MITKTYDNMELSDFYRKFFELYNVIQTNPKNRLRDREIDIISEMIVLNDKLKFKLFKLEGKYEVIKRLNDRYNENLTITNINTHLSELKKKGIIIEQEDRMRYINPKILKYLDTKDNNFEFIFKFNLK
jgi:hypothetical protein